MLVGMKCNLVQQLSSLPFDQTLSDCIARRPWEILYSQTVLKNTVQPLVIHLDPQPISIIQKIASKRVSYQASPTYSLGDFPGVITNWCCCRGEEIEAQLPWETTQIYFLMIDKEQTLSGCNHLSGDSMRTNSVATPLFRKLLVTPLV